MPEDFDRLQGLIYDVEARVYDIQEQQANIRADVDAVWAHPNMHEVHEAIDYRRFMRSLPSTQRIFASV